jgi:Rad3-related DNA helicases
VDEESGEAAPTRAIAVIQAGTGVGKSLAYCAPAIALALARGTRVLISTATVALQEQLVQQRPAGAGRAHAAAVQVCAGQGAWALCVQAQA